jgi:predicted ATP-grasp superfamily ATP-dependent carboligase
MAFDKAIKILSKTVRTEIDVAKLLKATDEIAFFKQLKEERGEELVR